MKKNISINIGGIIFHIEEDGYDKLKNYLDKINSYFADFQDSQEIVNDIENRIAELLLSKLKDDKQVINQEDIDSLIASLGSISDFEAAEKINEPIEDSYQSSEESSTEDTTDKKLYRDTQRSVMGGVASGIAHYFGLDPIWIRLALLIATSITLFFGVGFLIIITYFILWVALPANPFLKENKKIKKLYRSNDGVVIAGVAKGLSVYLGVDVAIVRLLFVAGLLLGGPGLVVYIVLWLITPKANSLTEKMEMQGTPITLANIEKSIKSNFKVKDGEESTLVKVLLFPFRLVALVLNAIAKVLGPVLNVIVQIIRVILGIFLIGMGLGSAIFASVLTAFSQGWIISEEIMNGFDIPLGVLANTITPEMTIVGFLLLIIPAIFLIIAGASVLAKKWLLSKTVGFTMLGLYVISLFAGVLITFRTVLEFNQEAEVKEELSYIIPDSSAINFESVKAGFEDYEHPSYHFKGYEGTEVMIVKTYSSRGKTEEIAQQNAQMISHNVKQVKDSIIQVDKHIGFKKDAKMRAQELDLTIMIPFGKAFTTDNYFSYKIRHMVRNAGYRSSNISDHQWMFNGEGVLKCIDCNESDELISTEEIRYSTSQTNEEFYKAPFEPSENWEDKYFEFSNFNTVKSSNGIFVELVESNDYYIKVSADGEFLDKVNVDQSGRTLKIYYDDQWNWKKPYVKVVIRMPKLENIHASSASVFHVNGFHDEYLDFDLSSSAKIYASGDYRSINIDASSAANVYLQGTITSLDIEASSSAMIDASMMEARNVDADASSAASITVSALNRLDAQASSGASIKYIGDPYLQLNESSGGRISKY